MQSPHRTKGRSQCVALSLSLPPVRPHLLSSAAFAADMAIAPPPYAAPVVEDFGGWYLRGDIGFSNQRVDRLSNAFDSTLVVARCRRTASTPQASSASASATRFNNWFRADVTGEYRGNAQLPSATDRLQQSRRTRARCRYLSWQQVGVGGSGQRLCRSRHLVVHDAVHRRRRRRCADFDLRTSSIPDIANVGGSSPSVAFATTRRSGILPGRLHAGLAYKVTPNFTVELAYRYLDHGRWPDRSISEPSTASTRSTTRWRSRTSPRTTSSSACAGI